METRWLGEVTGERCWSATKSINYPSGRPHVIVILSKCLSASACFFLILLAACSLEESDAKGIFVQGTEIAYGTLQVRNNPKSSPSAYSIHNTTIFFRVVHFENHSIVLSYELDELSFSRQKKEEGKTQSYLCYVRSWSVLPFFHFVILRGWHILLSCVHTTTTLTPASAHSITWFTCVQINHRKHKRVSHDTVLRLED